MARGDDEWLNSGMILVGRAATGVLPMVMLSFISRSLGLHAMGDFATSVAVAFALAESADYFSERHIPRTALGLHVDGSRSSRLDAFNGLRVATLLAGGLLGFVLLMFIGSRDQRLANSMVLLAAGSVLLTKTLYATALTERQFVLLGAAPLVSLAVVTLICALLATFQQGTLVAFAVALHAAKLAEIVFLAARLGLPGLSFHRPLLLEQWRETQFLLFQVLLSSASVRLMVPLVALIAGTVTAGVLSIGVGLLSIISLVAVAITIPSYRRAVESRSSHELIDVFMQTRREWLRGLALSAVLIGPAIAICRQLLSPLFHIDDPNAETAIALIMLCGLLESMNLFAGAYYHACFRDRQLFALSTVNALICWSVVAIGVRNGSLVGMGWGFLASKMAGALVLYVPVMVSAHRRAVHVSIP